MSYWAKSIQMCHHQATAPISCGQRERDFMLDKLSAVSRGCGQLSSYHTFTTQTPPSHLPSPPDKKLGKLSTSTQDQIYLQLRNVSVSIVLRCGVFADRSLKSTVSCAGDVHYWSRPSIKRGSTVLITIIGHQSPSHQFRQGQWWRGLLVAPGRSDGLNWC